MTTEVRELKRGEFSLAEKLWEQYRGQKADPVHERIFGVFVDGSLAVKKSQPIMKPDMELLPTS